MGVGERTVTVLGSFDPLTLSWPWSEMVVMRRRACLRILKEKQRNFIACLLLMDQ